MSEVSFFPARRGRTALTRRVDTCGWCHYCRRGESLFCEHFNAAGVARDGGFAEYIK